MRRVLVDTNVVISALLFPDSTPSRALRKVLVEDRLVLTAWILDELHEVVARKRADLLPALDEFLAALAFEVVEPGAVGGTIADPDDKPILDAALSSEVDVIVTGDRHFLELTLERPEILTPRAYLDCPGDGRDS